ncbi:outer membrane protein assembly factor BamA [Tabrizicola sp.]|uniref:outer membrane protein assembly factor BamA n=1 Tax=Tabrizicola sp. TaxID=2005166 RepID=UPI001A528CDA|nr:outer membrane protein assembly factor BamA [Tabrizicola sp.]MBL9072420.1 outer membrane protein assembly factor BamA [Tabrizicola sp.]
MTQSATKGRSFGARSRARLYATAVFLGAATVSAPFLTPAIAQVFSFSNVEIQGNERVDVATILSYAGISRGEEVSAAQLNDAYQRIMNSNLFETVELVPQGSTLVIKVVEYPIVNVISIEGNNRLKDEKLSELIQSQPRRIYSPSQAEADAAAIAEAYRVAGRLAATVTPKIIRRDGNRVDLVFEITEGKVVEIERLSFVGNKAFSDRRLRQVLETKQAGMLRNLIQRDTYVPERLELDKKLLTDFYLSRGFIDFQVLDASAEVSRERDATFVTFTVREGLSYNIGNVTTVSEVEGLDAAEFEAVQKIRPGQTYSPLLIDNNITRMETLALKKGLNFIRIEPRLTRNQRGQVVDVEFAIVRGEKVFVERIDIEGNTTTLDQVVRRQFRTVEGDPFNPREVRQAAERIRALGFFADARVNADQGSDPDQVVVNVDVEEQPTGSLSFGLAYSVASGVGVNVAFSETNFLGRGQKLALSISTASANQSSSFSFTEPALLGRDLSFTVGAFYRTSESDYSVYDTRNIGFTTGIGFPLGEQSSLDLRFGVAEDKLYNYTGDSTIIAAEEAQGALSTISLGYTYEYDNRITGLNPKGGVLLRFGQDFAGLGGDNEYIKTTALALAETKVWHEEVTLRAIFEGGAISSLGDSQTRVTDRFFGNSKIRGFEPNGIGPRDLAATDDDALGGNMFAVARFEADFPLGLPEEYGITGGAFMDVGSVWSLNDTNGGAVDDSFIPRATVGVSIFWNTPIGPLRFNFSHAVKKEDYDKEQSFDLTISTKF